LKKIFVKKPGSAGLFLFLCRLVLLPAKWDDCLARFFTWCNSAAPETNSAAPETMAAEHLHGRDDRGSLVERAFRDNNLYDASHFSASRRNLRVTLF
jgi:hypothetical protein